MVGYYAAVDTLWREVDLQSVESFIDFGRALDASFSYLGAEPSTAAYRRYSTNNWTKRGHDEKGDHDDNICPTDNDDHDHDAVQLHSHGSFSSLLSLTTSSKSMSANSPSASSSMAILRPSRRSARTGESPLSSSPGSLSSSSSSSSSSSTELSSLLCAPSPGRKKRTYLLCFFCLLHTAIFIFNSFPSFFPASTTTDPEDKLEKRSYNYNRGEGREESEGGGNGKRKRRGDGGERKHDSAMLTSHTAFSGGSRSPLSFLYYFFFLVFVSY